MDESEKKKSFWTSMPGIFTGIAAIITALAGLYGALTHTYDQKSSTQTSPLPFSLSTTTTKNPKFFQEWPIVGEETFTEIPGGWPLGNCHNVHFVRCDTADVEGKYRWDIEFKDSSSKYIVAPYGPSTDFYVAVDIRYVSDTPGQTSAGISFGRHEDKEYVFNVASNSLFNLIAYDGDSGKQKFNWTSIPFSINLKETNRISVLAEEQKLTLYINGRLVGQYRDPTFLGGKVGLNLESYRAGISTVVDFDNFEYRRKP